MRWGRCSFFVHFLSWFANTHPEMVAHQHKGIDSFMTNPIVERYLLV